jgi:hypothetical protein
VLVEPRSKGASHLLIAELLARDVIAMLKLPGDSQGTNRDTNFDLNTIGDPAMRLS